MKKARPTITFAIPFYAEAAYLGRAIESVLAQSYPHWELVVCDDSGSPPGAEPTVRSYTDGRIRYQRNERNLGLAANWNRCLDSARTDFVTLLHADDKLRTNYAETMIRSWQRSPEATALFSRAQIIDKADRATFSFPDLVKRFLVPSRSQPVVLQGAAGIEALLRGDFIICPTLCYRMSALGSARFDERWRFATDFDLITRLILEGHTLVGVQDVAYDYRRHPDAATVKLTANMRRFEEEVALYDELASKCRSRGWERAAAVAAKRRIVLLNLLYCLVTDTLRLRVRSALAKLRFLLFSWR